MITEYEQNRMRDHGEAMIVIRLFTPLSFMLQVQMWMQLTVLMLLLEISLLEL